MKSNDRLTDFERETFDYNGITHEVYRTGKGPAVIVIHEAPGLTPKVADFARLVSNAGMTAVCPSLLGEPGRPPSKRYLADSGRKLCVAKEFRAFATGVTAPIIDWLRALARAEHTRCGGPGVGAVGMCFSGGFALAMSADPSVLAPVLSQPSLPLSVPFKRRNESTIDCSPIDLDKVRQRFDADPELCVLGYRFSNDRLVPDDRFAYLRSELGDRFHGVTFDSSPGNAHGYPAHAHSVLTENRVDSAVDEVIAFFSRRLLTT